MNAIRLNIGIAIFVFVTALGLAVFGPLVVILSPVLPLKMRYALPRAWTRLSLWTLRVFCSIDAKVEGLENLPDTPSIIFCKHQSTWETFYLNAYFPAAVFVAKKELLYIPFFGWAMWALRYITVDRGAKRAAVESMCKQAVKRLADGLWVVIFPEGTRRPVDAEPNYKIGGAIMAERTGALVVPIALDSGKYWPRRLFAKHPGTIRMKVLPAIDPAGMRAVEVLALAQKNIEAAQQELYATPVD